MKTKLVALMVATVLCFFAIPAFADTSATLSLSGSVAKSASISVVATDAASNLTLTSTPNSAIAVGTLTEVCNSNSGYVVTVSSSNGGYLIGSSSSDSIAYTLYLDGSAVSLSWSPTTILSGYTKTTGTSQTLSVNYTGNSALTADTYKDTLTFTIAAN